MKTRDEMLHDTILALWDKAEEKTVRGMLKVIQANSKLTYDRGPLVRILMEAIGFKGWVHLSHGERHRALYKRVDMAVAREPLEGLR